MIWIEDLYSRIGFKELPEEDYIGLEIRQAQTHNHGSYNIKIRGMFNWA